MDTLEICWFIIFVCAALWCGSKASDTDFWWMAAAVGSGFFAVFTAHSVVATVFYWFESVIPSPTSDLNPITAGMLTLVLCLAFIMFSSLAGIGLKALANMLFSSKTVSASAK